MSFVFDALLYVLPRLPKKLRESIMGDMLIPPISNNPNKVQLARLGHVHFEHPDLEKFKKFAVDFGFVEVKEHSTEDRIYYRGYGRDRYIYVASRSKDGIQKFKGPSWVAKNEQEFEKAKKIPGAVVSNMNDAPGGGQRVTFQRVDNTYIHIIWGQEEQDVDSKEPTATHEQVGPMNRPFEKMRKGLKLYIEIRRPLANKVTGKFQRFHSGPALVHKLGHLGYVVPDFDNELKWYTDNFNFVPSDILYHWDFSNMDVLTFMHLDLGNEFSDHHCFFMQRAALHVKKAFVHHTSFEVADFDTQLLGHDWLARKGWQSVWGVGRHVLGSQIFDYWADPSGFKIEHYADGDVVNKDTPTRREVVGPMSVWGPEVPKDFGEKITTAGRGTKAYV
jgi:catechol 2,3-dioxygenase-like lactoylglutathione lyase family enzyme